MCIKISLHNRFYIHHLVNEYKLSGALKTSWTYSLRWTQGKSRFSIRLLLLFIIDMHNVHAPYRSLYSLYIPLSLIRMLPTCYIGSQELQANSLPISYSSNQRQITDSSYGKENCKKRPVRHFIISRQRLQLQARRSSLNTDVIVMHSSVTCAVCQPLLMSSKIFTDKGNIKAIYTNKSLKL